MWCSTFTTITSHNRPNSSELEDEWRINNFLGRPTNDQSDRFFNFSYTNWKKLRNSRRPSRQELGLSIDFQMV
jgi:hypothetical protein